MRTNTEPVAPALEVTPPKEMIKPTNGTTKSGFAFCYDADVMDDMDLFELLVRADNGDPMGGKLAVTHILGADGCKALYDHLRAKDGRVRWTSLYKELVDITNATKAGKN